MMKKFNFIDLFAGCGGLSLGLEESNFKSILYNEINESAAETYKINRADEIEYIPDVNDIDNLQRFKNVDLICGGPPCQGFSGIGHRRTYKADKKDMPRNLLFNKMVSIISEVEPKIFLFVNSFCTL